MGVSLAFHYRPSLSQLSVITRGRALGSFNQEETAVSKETVLFRMLQCISGALPQRPRLGGGVSERVDGEGPSRDALCGAW